MLTFTDAQLNSWLVIILFPLARILGVVTTAPLFNNAALPIRIRLVLGIAIALALSPALPQHVPILADSWAGLFTLIQQVLIGIALGFTMRMTFAAVDVAGELIGLQMGLSFAVFFDPQNATQSPIVSELLGLMTLLIFIALNGHLMVIALLAQSFTSLPISPEPFASAGWGTVVRWATTLFSAGVMMALPMIASLLVTNIALGILTKAAPQFNLFAVGFPITIITGFTVLALTMPYFAPSLEKLFNEGFFAMNAVASAGFRTP